MLGSFPAIKSGLAVLAMSAMLAVTPTLSYAATGSVRITISRTGFIFGGGSGTLHFEGKRYALRVGGVSGGPPYGRFVVKQERAMSTRRQFIQSLPAVGTAFAVAGHLVVEDHPARAQAATVPLKEHFHPKGKAPSKHTLDVLKRARDGLPFADKRDLDEQKRGLIAPMKDLKIMADGGHVAWDMERFQFLDKQDEFDSIHPSLVRQSKLNNNYGLYEVIPGINR